MAPFDRKDPQTWFRQIEVNFELSKVADDREKYMCVQARSDNAVNAELRDFFDSPPASDLYNSLKKTHDPRILRFC